MSYFKRSTDFLAGFAAFSATIYLFCEYMAYDFQEIESLTEKIKVFFSTEPRKDYKFYIPLIALLLISCLFSTVFHKLPWLTLAVSAFPMIQVMVMFNAGRLYERPMIYVVLTSLHMIGCLYECIRRDKADRRRRSALAVDLLGLTVALFTVFLIHTAKGIPELDFTKANIFEQQLYNLRDTADLSVFKYTSLVFAAFMVVRLIHRDLYFIDAILSVGAAAVLIYMWNAEKIPIFGEVLVTLGVAYAIARIAVMLFCRPKPKKKRKKECEKVNES